MPAVDTLAVIAGKLSARAIRAIGAGLGSNLPGKVSRAISPAVLGNLAKQCKLGVVAVSGTNGKSTTTGYISSIFDKAGYKVAHNRQGANLVTGITASLIDAASWSGELAADYGLFEIDEAALPVVAREVPIMAVVVTNLFRDQLDRFGELDTTASLIGRGIAANRSRPILNADDPNVAQLAADSEPLYYGIENVLERPAESCGADESAPAAGVQELAYCPKCGGEYKYDSIFYGQIGHYFCQSCGNKRPSPQVIGLDVRVKADRSTLRIKYQDKEIDVVVSLPGMFNVCNALAAAAAAFSLNVPADKIAEGISGYTTLFGRSERVVMYGKTCLIQLIKNPAGASQVVRAAVSDPNGRILIAINDNIADGRDVSWLWDAEFELLTQHKRPIIVSGLRFSDMALRLKYGGFDAGQIITIPSLENALKEGIAQTAEGETLWVLPTYTCLLELQKIVKSMGYSLSGT